MAKVLFDRPGNFLYVSPLVFLKPCQGALPGSESLADRWADKQEKSDSQVVPPYQQRRSNMTVQDFIRKQEWYNTNLQENENLNSNWCG
jgi:hypothetical protein